MSGYRDSRNFKRSDSRDGRDVRDARSGSYGREIYQNERDKNDRSRFYKSDSYDRNREKDRDKDRQRDMYHRQYNRNDRDSYQKRDQMPMRQMPPQQMRMPEYQGSMNMNMPQMMHPQQQIPPESPYPPSGMPPPPPRYQQSQYQMPHNSQAQTKPSITQQLQQQFFQAQQSYQHQPQQQPPPQPIPRPRSQAQPLNPNAQQSPTQHQQQHARREFISRQLSQPVQMIPPTSPPMTPYSSQQPLNATRTFSQSYQKSAPPPPQSTTPQQQYHHKKPHPSEKQTPSKPRFKFVPDIPSPTVISTNSAEIAISTEFFGDEEYEDQFKTDLLESRARLANTLIDSLKEFSACLDEALPALSDLPTNTQVFRTATLNRCELMSKETHQDFLKQKFRNKICLMYPEETSPQLWEENPEIIKSRGPDWREEIF